MKSTKLTGIAALSTDELRTELAKREHEDAIAAQLHEKAATLERQRVQREALATISAKIQEAMILVKDCEKLSDETGVTFNFDVAYGMGGTYYPKTGAASEGSWDNDTGWVSSSKNC